MCADGVGCTSEGCCIGCILQQHSSGVRQHVSCTAICRLRVSLSAVTSVGTRGVGVRVSICARGACGAACCVMCSVHCVRTDGARYIFNQSVVKTNTPVGGSAPWVSPSASILPRHRTDGSPPRALRSRHGHAKATAMQCESPHAGALHRSAASVPGQPSQRPVHSLLHSGTGRARVERSVGSVGRVGR